MLYSSAMVLTSVCNASWADAASLLLAMPSTRPLAIATVQTSSLAKSRIMSAAWPGCWRWPSLHKAAMPSGTSFQLGAARRFGGDQVLRRWRFLFVRGILRALRFHLGILGLLLFHAL